MKERELDINTRQAIISVIPIGIIRNIKAEITPRIMTGITLRINDEIISRIRIGITIIRIHAEIIPRTKGEIMREKKREIILRIRIGITLRIEITRQRITGGITLKKWIAITHRRIRRTITIGIDETRDEKEILTKAAAISRQKKNLGIGKNGIGTNT